MVLTVAEDVAHYAGAGGLGLVATRYGAKGGAPVLLLHGGGQTRGAWVSASRALAASGFHAVALDLRGHGDSDWSADNRYTLDAFADDLRAVLATFDAAPLLVGASLGGLASLLAAGEAPAAPTAGIVLVDIVPWMEKKGGEQVVGFMRGTSGGFDTLEEAADAVAGYLPHRPRPERLDGLSRNLRQKADGRWYWHWDPGFVAPQDGWDMEAINARLSAAARAVPAPLLLVHGTNSEIVSAEGAARFRAMLPEAQVIPIEGAHHMVAGDDNDAFVSAILPFLKGHAA
ncbi:alpha/beta fold hydrolase [Sphingomonas jatrophae]|uniref:Lysophospholipase, alpha-beta hydrolase superfamily n=1 Tax=Sphingomonas jatrophae TaxID=1166337 RepID=A0A1I6KJU9_9SPHN|nr:alpha/beta hydrolase [Sphingomonas jatrophae]SFR91523.1 Lysophospholipase, alpha-beta hydrolase superfamily [Sphingomonas jatrophae]